MLKSIILKLKDSKEFFIRKAIGWILREYSKTDPGFVVRFVQNHELSGLSHREALKWLERQ
jgi:3-methyladenine DNA glycosylase AlkD